MGEPPVYHQHAGPQPFEAQPHFDHHHHRANSLLPIPTEDEDYTIKCICSYRDDDGHTVLCEQCNTWQHILCYYLTKENVPEVHKCSDCYPRELLSGAEERQRRRREAQASGEERKSRKPGPKGHRKLKTKDQTTSNGSHTNGWSPGNDLYDRASGSPHDLPPPLKRAKMHHRNTALISHSHRGSRRTVDPHTNATFVPHIPLVDCPPNYFSPAFMAAYDNDAQFSLTSPDESNEWSDLGMAREFSQWLDDPEKFNTVSKGKKQSEVFKRSTEPTHSWPPPVEKVMIRDENTQFHGKHPVWQVLVANQPIKEGTFIGELIGTIGHCEEYKANPRNNWSNLRHPDHFVFFHPDMPIYIDCRLRGSLMRYVRRGCHANAKITTIVTGERDVHFCFTAIRTIAEGEEIVALWDMHHDRELNEALIAFGATAGLLERQLPHRKFIDSWVGTLFTHFGDCACRHQHTFCLLDKHDKRIPRKRDAEVSSAESLHAIDGIIDLARFDAETSTTHKYREDVDRMSSARSSRSQSSRDPSPIAILYTPNTSNGLIHSPTDRDHKKRLGATRRDKASRKQIQRSDSSTTTPLTTPYLMHDGFSRQQGSRNNGWREHKEQSTSRSSASDPSTPTIHSHGPPDSGAFFNVGSGGRPASSNRPPQSSSPSDDASRPTSSHGSLRPRYVDASTQTDHAPIKSARLIPSLLQQTPYLSPSQGKLYRLKRLRTLHQVAVVGARLATGDEKSIDCLPPASNIGTETRTELKQESLDVEMSDGVMTEEQMQSQNPRPVVTPNTVFGEGADTAGKDVQAQTYNSPTEADEVVEKIIPEAVMKAMPMGCTDAIGNTVEKVIDAGSKVGESVRHSGYRNNKLHVDLPPSQFQQPGSSDVSGDSTDMAVFMNGVVQSPTAANNATTSFAAPMAPMSTPILTPGSSTSLTQPSPVRKKMSLQDYSQRLKNKTPLLEKSQGGGGLAPSPKSTDSAATENKSEQRP